MSTRGSIAYGFENGCTIHVYQEMSDDSLRIEVEVSCATFTAKLDAEALAAFFASAERHGAWRQCLAAVEAAK